MQAQQSARDDGSPVYIGTCDVSHLGDSLGLTVHKRLATSIEIEQGTPVFAFVDPAEDLLLYEVGELSFAGKGDIHYVDDLTVCQSGSGYSYRVTIPVDAIHALELSHGDERALFWRDDTQTLIYRDPAETPY